jgi:hypothetical protein
MASMDESFHVTLDKDKVKEYVDYIGKPITPSKGQNL